MGRKIGGLRGARQSGFFWVVAVALCFGHTSFGDTDDAPRHLTDARGLVAHLSLQNTGYRHGPGTIVWDGAVAAYCDCSELISQLLMHSYAYTQSDLKAWFGSRRPTARRYHDAIAAGNGFARIDRLEDARPGDLLAVKFSDIEPGADTGHIMIVNDTPKEMSPSPPLVEGAEKQWRVAIIDSSGRHGTDDTRYEKGVKHTGVGAGFIRIYTAADGNIIAYTWSPQSQKKVYGQASCDMVIGRLVPGYRPTNG